MRNIVPQSRAIRVLLGAGALVGLWAAAHATVVSGSSSSYADSIDLSALVLNLDPTLTSGPAPTASGTAPSAYTVTNSVVSLAWRRSSPASSMSVPPRTSMAQLGRRPPRQRPASPISACRFSACWESMPP